ncbi:MAG: hypothetical protein ALECFALPRED_002197 [Alectoria fallacina]|uniref:Uncharacterized protein n=1 Tax=Alectoria fallacina TaxID=1903189 RepID=A0A8H3EJ71_9LECA|nr:MAG: hypothetical protein ALECFALPRED_002197 [Alectoria fallacina]
MPTCNGRFPHNHGKRQLDGYQAPVVTTAVSSIKTSFTATTKATTPKTHTTKSKQPKRTHTHKTAKHTSTKTGSYTFLGSLGQVGTSVPSFLGANPYGSYPTGTNPLGSCYLGAAYGCTSGGTGGPSPTKSPPPIYPNTTATYTSSASLKLGPHGPPLHGPPPYGPPGGPPAFPASSLSALEAGVAASPTISSTGIVTYQNLIGYPIESGAVPPFSTEIAGGPPPSFPGGPSNGPPLCPPPVTITFTSTATVIFTEPAPVAPLTTLTSTQLSSAPFGLGNGTAFHGPTDGTGTGSYLTTFRPTNSANTSAKTSTKISHRTSTLTSAKTSNKAAGKISDRTSTPTSTKTLATATALSPYN